MPCSRYSPELDEAKLEQMRAKARERMARNQQLLRAKSQEEQDAARDRARVAQATYRSRHRMELRAAQRTRRQLDYISKYGQLAYDSKVDQRDRNAEAKRERMRRARRSGGKGKTTKRAVQAREKAARRSNGRA